MRTIFFFILASLNSGVCQSQNLSIKDLASVYSKTLTQSESFLLSKGFVFSNLDYNDNGEKTYAFALDQIDGTEFATEFLLISFKSNSDTPYIMGYQLGKKGWIKCRSEVDQLGYKKIKTSPWEDGSLTSEYSDGNNIVWFNVGVASGDQNVQVYTINFFKPPSK